jgi:hypothetical protein
VRRSVEESLLLCGPAMGKKKKEEHNTRNKDIQDVQINHINKQPPQEQAFMQAWVS